MKTLKKRSDFLYLKDGHKWITPSFILQTREKQPSKRLTTPSSQTPQQIEENSPCFGFTVTKKIGNAVTRNLIRRRLKEAVRHLDLEKCGKYSKAGHDYVFIARQDVLERDFKDILLQMRIAFQRIHGNQNQKRDQKNKPQNNQSNPRRPHRPGTKADLKDNGPE